MNTRKQVLVMSALLMVTLIIVGIYAAWYPSRAIDAEKEFAERSAERASILFARNCRLCHGDVGQGGLFGARLPAAPALDRPDLQAFVESKATLAAVANAASTTITASDGSAFKTGQTILIGEERMRVTSIDANSLTVERAVGHTEATSHPAGSAISTLDAAGLRDMETLITNTITCGRVGAAMPAWSQAQGGPLSDEQIRQLMVLITTGRWDLVEEEVNREDRITARLLEPLPPEETFVGVSDVSVFTAAEAIRIGEERLRVRSVPSLARDAQNNLPKDRSGFLTVERGVLGTTPLDHPQESVIYRFPETAEPSINQSACGQTARPPAPVGTPELIEPFEGRTVEVVAQNIQFDLREITVPANGRVRVRLDNRDTGVEHNIAFYQSSTNLQPVSPGSVGLIFVGPGVDDTAFDIPTAGSYFFRCDIHPTTMTGTFTVR